MSIYTNSIDGSTALGTRALGIRALGTRVFFALGSLNKRTEDKRTQMTKQIMFGLLDFILHAHIRNMFYNKLLLATILKLVLESKEY
jgi:hypothetical protein